MKYEPVIGLEIHTQLKTRTKMFCDSLNDPDEKHSNVNICPICLAHPGTLPAANLEAIKKTILLGLALDCRIAENSFFERKNYFYPDLPKGYQISQYQAPLCTEGHFEISVFTIAMFGYPRDILTSSKHLKSFQETQHRLQPFDSINRQIN